MSNLQDHARFEMRKMIEGEEYDRMLAESVLSLLKVFSEQGHSGMSAGITTDLFNKLARFEPLGPLTGEDDEWNKNIMDGKTWQNRRCSHVFKDLSGAYDIQGFIFEEPDGVRFTSFESRRPVTFPYVPKSEIVKVLKERAPDDSVIRCH